MRWPGTFSLVLLAVILVSLVAAEVPQMINYQGFLTKPNGSPVNDGTYQIKFKIYGSATSDDSLWYSGFQPVEVTSGRFTHHLGTAVPLPGDLFSIDTIRYLGITVESDAEIEPRTKLSSVPYAYQSLRADAADNALAIADNAVNSDKILDGSIGFEDIGRNSAITGQVVKWDGAAWVADDDLEGAGSGWVDDGPIVRLENETDDVGIGTTTPDEKLTVSGNAHVTGDLRIDGSITPAPIGWRHSGAQVYSGTAPTVWTDLDLSGYVGTNYALVLIKVKGASGSATHVFRPNGDTDEYWRCSDLSDMGAQGHKGECAEAGIVVAETDGNGIVEWKGQGTNVTLTLLGYIR